MKIGTVRMANHSIDTIIKRPKDLYYKKELALAPQIQKHMKSRLPMKIKSDVSKLLLLVEEAKKTSDSEDAGRDSLTNTHETNYL